MADRSEVIICQKCGRGFTMRPNYREWLERRGVKIVHPVLCKTCFMKWGPRPKRKGTVKWFSARKKYGFIEGNDGEEVFFHQCQLVDGSVRRADEGEPVRFHVRYEERGPKALNVEFVGE